MEPPFQLSQSDIRPMYQQIMDSIKQLVIAGHWLPGHSLPSIRELAVSVKVSVITVKRAYQELEREGVIITRHGLGSYVHEQAGSIAQQKEQELLSAIDSLLDLADTLKLSNKQLIERIEARKLKLKQGPSRDNN